nr:MAG TPA: hypothetical protein [Caudoviricetes sp.]
MLFHTLHIIRNLTSSTYLFKSSYITLHRCNITITVYIKCNCYIMCSIIIYSL